MTTVISGSYPAVNSDSDATINGLTVGKGGGAAGFATAFGFQALNATNTGSVAGFGYQSLFANTSGEDNTAVGSYRALYSNTTGNNNIAVGRQALQTNTTGSNNVAIGRDSLFANTTASNNTAVGYQAGYTNTTGIQVTYLGRNAGYLTTGSFNTFVGSRAGYNTSTGTANTYVGIDCGIDMTTGSKNTIIGGFIGNQGGLDIRTSSNYIVLSDGDGNPRGYFDNNGLFSIINATTNTVKMYVSSSTASFTSDHFQSLSFTAAGTGWNHFVGYASIGSTLSVKIQGNGNLQNANNSYGAISDIKLKENIVDATPKLDKLMQVKVRNYNLKGDYEQHKQLGVVAQELEQVFPSLVDESIDKDKDGNDLGTTTKAVKYSVFVPMLIKAVQELNAKVEAQALEIATLKGQ